MKTKIITLLSLTVCILFLIGCDAKESLEKASKQTPIAVSEFVFDEQETINTINAQKNLKASNDIIFDVPADISSIGEFKYDILPQASFKDFEEDFLDLFEFIFPESIMNKDEKTYLCVDTTPQIEGTPVLSVEEHRNELLNGERQFLLLYYDEFSGNDFKYEEGQVIENGHPLIIMIDEAIPEVPEIPDEPPVTGYSDNGFVEFILVGFVIAFLLTIVRRKIRLNRR